MTERHWVILDAASGAVLQADFITEGCHPRFKGWPWDAETQVCHVIPEEQVEAHAAGRVVWGGESFIENWVGVRAAKWTAAKAIRDALENGVAETPIGPVQCDNRSKIKITGLVTMAQLAVGSGQPFEEEFTLADNRVVQLDAGSAIAMGVAVAHHVSAVFAVARDLREQLDAAGTLAAIDAIDIEAAPWPGREG